MQNVSFVKGVTEFENPENVPTLIVLGDLRDSAYSTKVSQLFTKGSHHRYISLVPITQNLFHQSPSSRDFSLNSKLLSCLRIRETKHRLTTWLDKFTPKTFPVFIKQLEACKDANMYLFLDLTQSINDILSFRTNIFPWETCEVFAPVQANLPVKVTTTLFPRP